MPGRSIEFCCPRCKGELQTEPDRLYCSKCDVGYPILNGIACFSDPSTYYGEIRREQMTDLLRDADKLGYREGLRRHLTDPFVHTYAHFCLVGRRNATPSREGGSSSH